jgi:hypothetical protein
MVVYTGIFARPVNAYYRNSSLLLQFILSEFIATFTESQKLAELCHLKPSPLPVAHDRTQQAAACQSQIKAAFSRLVGSNSCERLIAWHFEEGMLSKLKTYCILFSQNNERDEKELLCMHHYIDKAWQQGVQAKILLNNSELNNSEEDRPQFLAALEKMNQSIQRFAKQMARILLQFREDENIIFFLLRHRTELETVYSPRFLNKLLLRMYPKGLCELKQLLKAKYNNRGFTNISSGIDAHFAELEAAP